jgi:hypothetical protein
MNALRRLTDGVIPQAVITGSLSFSHIHDLAQKHGQTGWKSWTYPLSVDLLTVAAYQKLITAHRAKRPALLPWFWFLLSLAASLAANVIATGGRDPLSIAIGVWPAVAFLGCTLIGHTQTEPTSSRTTIERTTIDRLTVETPTAVEQVPAPPPVVAIAPAGPPLLPPVAPDLLAYARTLAVEHEERHGEPITATALRDRLGVALPLAQTVHAHLTAASAA